MSFANERSAGSSEATDHYARLSADYNARWSYTPEYVAATTRFIIQTLELKPSDVIADLGGGTGLYASHIADSVRPEHPIFCVDPSAAMLQEVPSRPDLVPVQSTFQDFVDRKSSGVPTPELFDAVLIRAAIHHADDPAGVIQGVANRLRPGGRLVVAMCPRKLDYPLFKKALDRYESAQPDASGIAEAMESAGLETSRSKFRHRLEFSLEAYCDMVKHRYMSILSSFSDEELAAGIEEIRATHSGPTLSFFDVFIFIKGRKPADEYLFGASPQTPSD